MSAASSNPDSRRRTIQIGKSTIIISRWFDSDFRLAVFQNSTWHSVCLDPTQLHWLVRVFKSASESQWSFSSVRKTMSRRRFISVATCDSSPPPAVKISEECDNGQLFYVVIPMDPTSNGWLPFLDLIQGVSGSVSGPVTDPIPTRVDRRPGSYAEALSGQSCFENQLRHANAIVEGGGEGEDLMGRFSSLQDETIHQILAGLRSHTQVAQLKTLSKKWLKIVCAYPVLEFDEEDCDGREESQWRICAELFEKFSRGTLPIVAVRIKIERFSKFYVDFYDSVLDLAASSSPEEIDISFGYGCRRSPANYHLYTIRYQIPDFFFSRNGKQFARLIVLKLKYCRFELFHPNSVKYSDRRVHNFYLCSSLRVLRLESVVFPDESILHSMIESASLLETLTLKSITVNCDQNFRPCEDFSTDLSCLKVVCLESIYFPNGEILRDMIESAPLLETLTLKSIRASYDERVISRRSERISTNISRLKVVCLEQVKLRDHRLLRSMIESASLLEIMTLTSIQVFYDLRKHPWESFSTDFSCLEIMYLADVNFPDERILRGLIDSGSLRHCENFSTNFSCLKMMYLEDVNFPDEGILRGLIDSAPLLKTLTLKSICVSYDPTFRPCENFSTNFSCLKVLYLEHVNIPDEEILRGMIDSALLLETLTLKNISVSSDPNFRRSCENFSRNFSCLKVLYLSQVNLPDEGILHSMIDSASVLETLTLSSIHVSYGFSTNFSCLKVLCLEHVVFPDEGILRGMIDRASVLESLTLCSIKGCKNLQVRNHPNLKFLEVGHCSKLELFEIGEIESLEEVRVICTYMNSFQIWSTPNLRALYTEENDGEGGLALDYFVIYFYKSATHLFR